jgi:hypothetical protein
MRTLGTEITQLNVILDRNRQFLENTALAYDQLAKRVGEAAAQQQALANGATLSQGGTRIRFPGGGSRLTNTSGYSGTSSYGLSPFGGSGRYTVDAKGNLRPT